MDLFSPCDFGPYRVRNRLVMAPMTRLRCGRDGVPSDMVAEYYAQRASMGLIVTEGAFPDLAARTWLGQPGIETAGQVTGWQKVTDAVHAHGGTIVMQIMHAGRLSHPTINGTGRVVSASATTAPGYTHNQSGRVDYVQAEALTGPEIERIIESWVREVNGIWPNVNNRVRLQARIVTALIGWALASISYLYFGSMNQLVSELGNRPDSDSDIPDAATEALATANIDPFDDMLSNPSLGSIVGEGSIARQDLLETFEALTRYASRGDDPRFPEVAAFANSVVERLQAMEQ